MTTVPKKNPRQMPKGGRKGGSVFPRVALNDALSYARKLVSKTHTSAQPRDVILSGVIGVKGGMGNVRMSALKQYGFLIGDMKVNFSADDLARRIAAAPTEELVPLYRQAMLRPTVFKKLFDTYHGDTVSKAKLKQRAADLKVHPDETATCIDLYVSGMTIAGLVTVDGDQITHVASSDVGDPDAEFETSDEGIKVQESWETEDDRKGSNNPSKNGANDDDHVGTGLTLNASSRSTPRAVFNVNVTLDSSLDIDKLQKHLELLKRFGAI